MEAVVAQPPTEHTHKACSRCILDTHDDPQIEFDEKGVCNHCRKYDQVASEYDFSEEEGLRILMEKIEEIKAYGKDKEFDCILGVSGGVDSTYLCIKAKEYGLRPLLVHFDNGWNSELAVANINKIVRKLGQDLYTYVVDWEEFKDLQKSYFKAGVLDLEVPTDHGFFSMLYKIAREKDIKYILSGHNIVTENVLPRAMIWDKMDLANIRDIHKKYGTRPLKTYPTMSFLTWVYYLTTKKFELVMPLNYMRYNKDEVKEIIIKELRWRDYGGKHYENIFTRFFQGYILEAKFKVYKRKAHLSNLICSGQMTREQALAEMQKPVYDAEQLKIDREFVMKKLDFTPESWEEYMKRPPVPHDTFASYRNREYVWHKKFFQVMAPMTPVLKGVFKVFFPKALEK